MWQEMKRRFDNPRLLLESHVRRILNLPNQPTESQKGLLRLVDTVQNVMRALSVMGLPVNHWDALLVPLLLPKLPKITRYEWGMSLQTNNIPMSQDFLTFIEKRANNLPQGATNSTSTLHQRPTRPVKANVATVNSSQPLHSVKGVTVFCQLCANGHRIHKCQRFVNLSIPERWDTVKRLSLCFNCLGSDHGSRDCTSRDCLKCHHRHHTMLCKSNVANNSPATEEDTNTHIIDRNISVDTPSTQVPQVYPRQQSLLRKVRSFLINGDRTILLATAKVILTDHNGGQFAYRALCDLGSQVSLITDATTKRMCLRRRPGEIRIEGVGSSAAVYSKGHITVQMQAAFDNNINFKLEAYVVPTITSVTPDTHIDAEAWSHLKDLPLADPTFATPSPVDLLVGADVLTGLFQEGFIQGSPEQLCALNTRLGWVVFGPVTSSAHSTLHTSLTAKCVNEQRLDTLLRSFWELEEPIPSSEIHVDDCETIFNDTVTRTTDGRYQVQILFRPDAPAIGESHQSAVRQFLQLERRLMNDPCLREQYITFMREYIALDHMEVSKQAFTNKGNGYFIPHHAVTTKFRVVFNVSAKISNGTSLNDTQFSGPQLHANIVDILHRFRKCKVAITADIQKMFRQILVDRRHRKWQQILWRELPNEPLQVYELKTVTYGMACSPFNAIRALRQCANDNYEVIYDPSRAAAARHSILNNFYVDDFLDSVDSDELSITRAQDVATILKQGQLILGKWNSNFTHVLSAITGTTLSAFELELNNSTTKVLGLYWDPVSDELFFKVGLVDDTSMHTKRKVLSDVAKLYDPTGVLAPVVVVAKLFIQDLWKAGLPWDAELPPELLSS
ncbi:uncharacterized protein LOC126765144 [Bactrocera neohumeralis]|uniref:uncharacterized protein LOC126765144 n=1 Tax=Bactrocera neohumeralis TaxID=98809 RepID=UPI0021650643|nr:uncharacterized protein LOC126765144 [Bactrocera neohumeralis]